MNCSNIGIVIHEPCRPEPNRLVSTSVYRLRDLDKRYKSRIVLKKNRTASNYRWDGCFGTVGVAKNSLTMRFHNSLSATLFINSEEERDALVQIEDCCDIVMEHELNNGSSIIQGLGEFARKPYHGSIKAVVTPPHWRGLDIPFRVTLDADCESDGLMYRTSSIAQSKLNHKPL